MDNSRTRSREASMAHHLHLTISDLCEELGVARSTFYDWRAAHKAPRCIKLPNGAIRIRRTDLDRWLEEHEDVG
jgi:excisionase family DNA binding protein